MNQEIKYTNDGRKVAVVGKLNAEQSIVQEIFVSGGNEVPSGESFVVSSLHDAPAEPWKEKRLRELDERFERERRQLERDIEVQRLRLREACEKAKMRANSLLDIAENAKDEHLSTLFSLLSGEITHFFVRSSYEPAIITWDSDKLYQFEGLSGKRVEAIKLISLYGASNGDLSYRLHRYSDGSGGGGQDIIPCRSYDEALSAAQEYLDSLAASYVEKDRGSLNLQTWGKIKGIVIPKEAKRKHQEQQESIRQQKIEKLRDELRKLEDQE